MLCTVQAGKNILVRKGLRCTSASLGSLEHRILSDCPFDRPLLDPLSDPWSSVFRTFPQEDICHVRECQGLGF